MDLIPPFSEIHYCIETYYVYLAVPRLRYLCALHLRSFNLWPSLIIVACNSFEYLHRYLLCFTLLLSLLVIVAYSMRQSLIIFT